MEEEALRKIAFMAAMAVTGLLISLVGMQFAEVAKANFVYPATKPNLIANVSYPANNSIYNQDKIRMIFRGEVLDWIDPIYGQLIPTEVYVSCYLDNKFLKMYPYSSSYFAYDLENLANGQHEAKVTMRCVYPGVIGGGYDYCIVYFTIQTSTNTSSPITITTPTISPTLTPTPTLSPSPSPSPIPSPILSPSPSPTIQPTIAPIVTSPPHFNNPYSGWIQIAVPAIVIVLLVLGLLVYLRRRKG